MKWFNPRRLLFVIASICLVFIFSGLVIIDSNRGDIDDSTASILESSEKVIPIRIRIPNIGVNAPIISVGLTEQKTMESPEEPSDAAWFKLGPSPGDNGNSVITGHTGWRIGPALFDDLDKLKVGDKVYVENEEGETLVFVVREMRVYGANEIVPEVWNNKEDSAHLNLITCSGAWNVSTGTFEKRLVVFTDLVT